MCTCTHTYTHTHTYKESQTCSNNCFYFFIFNVQHFSCTVSMAMERRLPLHYPRSKGCQTSHNKTHLKTKRDTQPLSLPFIHPFCLLLLQEGCPLLILGTQWKSLVPYTHFGLASQTRIKLSPGLKNMALFNMLFALGLDLILGELPVIWK